jgi:23S rRNA (cytidine1920-2'-O)/16S rRNA (cytidine1409-2'-O)-methyltransferase
MGSTKFVSRGGDKLEGALEHLGMDVAGKICLDVGASTGGFTDCLLQRGAAKVYAVDTAYGELAWKLRSDPRVVVKERTNILHDQDKLIEIVGKADIATIDAGWTRAELVVPEVMKYLKSGGIIILLIKPQYETVEQSKFKKTKILDDSVGKVVAEEVGEKLRGMGFGVSELFPSTIKGDSGNQEYFVVLR